MSTPRPAPSRTLTVISAIALAALIAGRPLVAVGQGPADSPRGMMGGMRGMMRSMMRGLVPPPGMTPEALPEADSAGARLVSRYCGQCHDLPSPRFHTEAEWPIVFDRMLGRMSMMGGMGMGGMGMGMMHGISAPSRAEAATLLDYLKRNAMRPARAEELARGDPDGRERFLAVCTGCHAPPSPSLHPPEEWPAVVARMRIHMRDMDRPRLPEDEAQRIAAFLGATATP